MASLSPQFARTLIVRSFLPAVGLICAVFILSPTPEATAIEVTLEKEYEGRTTFETDELSYPELLTLSAATENVETRRIITGELGRRPQGLPQEIESTFLQKPLDPDQIFADIEALLSRSGGDRKKLERAAEARANAMSPRFRVRFLSLLSKRRAYSVGAAGDSTIGRCFEKIASDYLSLQQADPTQDQLDRLQRRSRDLIGVMSMLGRDDFLSFASPNLPSTALAEATVPRANLQHNPPPVFPLIKPAKLRSTPVEIISQRLRETIGDEGPAHEGTFERFLAVMDEEFPHEPFALAVGTLPAPWAGKKIPLLARARFNHSIALSNAERSKAAGFSKTSAGWSELAGRYAALLAQPEVTAAQLNPLDEMANQCSKGIKERLKKAIEDLQKCFGGRLPHEAFLEVERLIARRAQAEKHDEALLIRLLSSGRLTASPPQCNHLYQWEFAHQRAAEAKQKGWNGAAHLWEAIANTHAFAQLGSLTEDVVFSQRRLEDQFDRLTHELTGSKRGRLHTLSSDLAHVTGPTPAERLSQLRSFINGVSVFFSERDLDQNASKWKAAVDELDRLAGDSQKTGQAKISHAELDRHQQSIDSLYTSFLDQLTESKALVACIGLAQADNGGDAYREIQQLAAERVRTGQPDQAILVLQETATVSIVAKPERAEFWGEFYAAAAQDMAARAKEAGTAEDATRWEQLSKEYRNALATPNFGKDKESQGLLNSIHSRARALSTGEGFVAGASPSATTKETSNPKQAVPVKPRAAVKSGGKEDHAGVGRRAISSAETARQGASGTGLKLGARRGARSSSPRPEDHQSAAAIGITDPVEK
jgi:hypothetical protein